MMKVPQERIAPASDEHSNQTSNPSLSGKSMLPPPFQLTAKNPSSQAANGPGGDPGTEGSAESMTAPLQYKKGDEADMDWKCQDPNAKVGDEWVAFAGDFNDEFQSILHAFGQDVMGCNAATGEDAVVGAKSEVGAGKKSGDKVTAATLEGIFTDDQRIGIQSFIDTGIIPDRLFNGDDVGYATVQQRLLMSAHILSTGAYKPGSSTQLLHAQNCGHWIDLVYNYAGASVGDINTGMMGVTDHEGNVVLGTGKFGNDFLGKHVKAKDLPSSPETDLDKIEPATKHQENYEKEQASVAKNKADREEAAKNGTEPPKEKKESFGRRKYTTFDKIMAIKPGDWVWVYNANGSADGGHSVLFSHWEEEASEVDKVKYRKAVCFSQGHPEEGGRQHSIYLGEKFYRVPKPAAPAEPAPAEAPKSGKGKKKAKAKPELTEENYITTTSKAVPTEQEAKPATEQAPQKSDPSGATPTASYMFTICAVTMIARSSSDTVPVTTAEEMLEGSGLTEGAENPGNAKYIKEVEAMYAGKLDRDALFATLRTDCQHYVDDMKGNLSEGQEKLLEEAMQTTSLSRLVWLTSRLRAIHFDVMRMRDAVEAEHGEAFDEKKAAADKNMAELDGQMGDLEADIARIQGEIAKLTEEKKAKDMNPELKKLKHSLMLAQINVSKLEKAKTKDEAKISRAKYKVDLLLKLIDMAKTANTDNQPAIKEIANQIYLLNVELAKDNKAKKELNKKVALAEKTYPLALVHPGNWYKQKAPAASTSLRQLKTMLELKSLVVKTPKAKKSKDSEKGTAKKK